MIHEVSGDILLSKAHAIAHGIAPNDHFKNGLALALRENWPALHKDFRHYCHTHSPKCGSVFAWMGAEGRMVFNLFTQEPAANENSHPGKAKLQHVHHCLQALLPIIEKEKIRSLALPRLATGVGGLSWEEVKPLIHKTLGELKIPVFVYAHYTRGEKANEPGVK